MHSTVRRNHQSKKFSAGFVLLFMLLVSQASFGQQPIEWTKPNFLWQGQKWKYHDGVPKQEYLELDYDDQSWSDVHTDSVGYVTADKSSWSGIGVFRMKFNVPDSLRGKRAELILLRSVGAINIYLDGKLITQSGTVAANATDEVMTLVTTPQYPIPVELDDKPSHVIAVSYSNHDSEMISRGWSGFV